MEIKISNPSNLPTIDYRTVKPLQGDLKDLSDQNYKKLKNVLIKRGFKVPLFLWANTTLPSEHFKDAQQLTYYIIDGHQRQRVMIKEDMQPYLVPYVLIEAANEQEAKAQLLEISSQYGRITQEGIDSFNLPEADLADLSFDALPEFSRGSEPEIPEDEPPEVSNEPAISKLGEIYQLGKHRLMCGDSTDFGSVTDLMNGVEADMVFTDPPYGVDYEGKTKDKLKIENDENTEVFAKALPNFITKSGAAYYVCCPAGNNFNQFARAFEEHCYQSSTIVWVKNTLVMGHGDYHYRHEPILYGWSKDGTHQFYGDRTQTTVWEVDRPTASRDHPTMKPVALVGKAINNSSKSGDIVLDLFGGSGSTLIACEQLDRTCYMMELDPKYCDVIRKRYAKFIEAEDWEAVTPLIRG